MPVDTATPPRASASRDRVKHAIRGGALLQKSGAAFVFRVSGNVLGLFTALLLARTLGLEQYGTYGFATASLQLLLVVGLFGTQTLVTREVAAARAEHDIRRVRGVMRFSLGLTLSLSVLVAVGINSALRAWPDLIDPGMATALGMLVWAMPLVVLMMVHGHALRGAGSVLHGISGESVLRPAGMFLIVAIGLLFIPERVDLTYALRANLVAAGFAALCMIILWRHLRPRWKSGQNASVNYRALGAVALSMVLIGVSRELALRTDRVMLGLIDGPASAGLYTVAARLSTMIDQFTYAFTMVIGPMIAAAHAENRLAALKRLIRKAARWTFLLSLMVALPLLLFAGTILGAFGPEFTGGEHAMILLVLSRLAAGLAGPATIVLTMTGHEKSAGITVALAAVLNILLNAILIPRYGAEGAAAATLLTALLWNARLVWLCVGRVGINPSVPGLFNRSRP